MTRTIPALALQNPGTTVSGALWNAGPKALTDFYTGVPLFRGRQSTLITTSTGAWTAMPLQTTDVDTDSGHSNSTNNTRYTCQVPGWYWVEGFVAWINSGAQSRIDVAIFKNSALLLGSQQSLIKPGSDFSAISAATMVQMAVGDFVELVARQNSGGNLNTQASADLSPSLNTLWIHS